MNTILYRIYDERDALLYVGASAGVGRRLKEHEKCQPWWSKASYVKLQHFESIDRCAKAEVKAIKSEHPRHNLVHCKPAVWSRKPRGKGGSLYQRANGLWVGSVTVLSVNGRQHRRSVSSRSKETAERKLAELKIELKL